MISLRQTFAIAAFPVAALAVACSAQDGIPGEPGPAGSSEPGEPGEPGLPGTPCWDLDENGSCDAATEDINQDGSCSVLDCTGQGTGGGTASLGYVGSTVCSACHAELYDKFMLSGHPYQLTKVENGQAPTRPYDNVTGGVPSPPLNQTWDDISYVIGGYGWKARYVGTDGYVLTGSGTDTTQWNFANPDIGVAQGSWVAYLPGEQQPYDFGRSQTTGWIPCEVGQDSCDHQDELDGMAGSFVAGGVQCEACHGPAAAHVADPHLVQPEIDRSAELCGQCHRRGDVETLDAEGGFIGNHEQYEELFQSKKHVMRCVDCHDPHASAKFADPNLNPTKGIRIDCASCHTGYDTNQKSATMQTFVDCIDCHMPRLAKSAVGNPANFTGDVRSHLFAINPVAAAPQFNGTGTESSPYITLKWACNHCHGVSASGKTAVELELLATGYHQ